MVESPSQEETGTGATEPSPHQHWGTEKAALGRQSSGNLVVLPSCVTATDSRLNVECSFLSGASA